MSDLLARYDRELRGYSEVWSTGDWHRDGPLWLGDYGDAGMVSYHDLPAAEAEHWIARAVDHFANHTEVAEFEWKTRGHDPLPDLPAQLLAAGFVAGELETVMAGELRHLVDVEPSAGLSVRRIDQLPDAAQWLARADEVQREVFGEFTPLAVRIADAPELSEAWVVEADGRIITVGRSEFVPDTEFVGLWGGSTLAPYRGRGSYRLLTAARARSALDRGYSLAYVDCSPMSRPILQRSELEAVTTTTPYLWHRPD